MTNNTQKELEKITTDNLYIEHKDFKGHYEKTCSIKINGFKISVKTSKWNTSKFIHSLTLEKGAMTFKEYKALLEKITRIVKDDK